MEGYSISKKELIKSPLNYVGGKFKLLPQILPLFPENIDTFYDLFCGGCNVGVNVRAKTVVCNDTEAVVISLMQDLSQLDSKTGLATLKQTINKYQLSKTNEEGFKAIRNDYNNGDRHWYMFYAMLTNAFNYQIRFNQKGEYNMPFGRNRSWFNPRLEANFIAFVDKLNDITIKFFNKDFRDFDVCQFNQGDLIYCDPPYLLTTASYNEQGGWREQDEIDLLNFLENINNKKIKFALSNVLEHKGQSNDILKDWAKDYNIHYLNHHYGNSNYQTKDRSKNGSVEVLITNY